MGAAWHFSLASFAIILFLGSCEVALILIYADFFSFSLSSNESHLQQGLGQPTFKVRSENKAISKIRYKTR